MSDIMISRDETIYHISLSGGAAQCRLGIDWETGMCNLHRWKGTRWGSWYQMPLGGSYTTPQDTQNAIEAYKEVWKLLMDADIVELHKTGPDDAEYFLNSEYKLP